MESSIMKKVLGIVVSLFLIISTLGLVFVFAIQYTFTEKNMETVFSALDFKNVIMTSDPAAYEQILNSAKENKINPEALDSILSTKAVSNIVGDCTASIVLGSIEGEDPMVSLNKALKPAIDKNADELSKAVIESIDTNTSTAISKLDESKGKMTEEQYAAKVADINKLAEEEKNNVSTSIHQLGDKVHAQVIQNPQFTSMVNKLKAFDLSQIFNVLKITSILCALILILMFLKQKTSAFWLSVNCMIIAGISFFIDVVLNAKTTPICAKIYQSMASSKLMAKISSSAVSQVMNYLTEGLQKYSIIFFIASIILLIIHLALSPLRKNVVYNNDGYFDDNYDDGYYNDDMY